jgi:hypothetical protein
MRISPGARRTRPTAGLRTASLCAAALLTAWRPVAALDTVAAGGRAIRPPASPCDLPFAQGESGTYTTAALRLSRAPAAGQTAIITIGVCANRPGAVRALIMLPDSFGWTVKGILARPRSSRGWRLPGVPARPPGAVRRRARRRGQHGPPASGADRVINNSQVIMNGPSYRPIKRPGQRVTTTGKEPTQ